MQLAHIAWKGIAFQNSDGCGIDFLHVLAQLHAVFHDKLFTERHNVLHAVPKRGHLPCHDIEAQVEVLAKALRRNLLPEVAVRRDQDTKVPSHVFGSSDATEGSILQDPQELPLHRHIEIADFV